MIITLSLSLFSFVISREGEFVNSGVWFDVRSMMMQFLFEIRSLCFRRSIIQCKWTEEGKKKQQRSFRCICVSCIHLIKWTNNTDRKKAKVCSTASSLSLVHERVDGGKWPVAEVFISVRIDREQKGRRNKWAGRGRRHRLRSIIVIRFFWPLFSLFQISFISSKSHRSFLVRTRAPSLLFTSTISLCTERIVWSRLVNGNWRLIICLSIDVHVIWFSPTRERTN